MVAFGVAFGPLSRVGGVTVRSAMWQVRARPAAGVWRRPERMRLQRHASAHGRGVWRRGGRART
eukprot:6788818-Prymnesium_polylepis.1